MFIDNRQDSLDGGSALSQYRFLHETTQTQNKCIQTYIPLAGFEPMVPVFERAKIFHVLDLKATVKGTKNSLK
jgi:hypothetical protein